MFAPVLGNDFVNWDDQANLVDNMNYRGLGWPQIRWMFSNFHMGLYQPLSWLTYGLDFVFWGMNPVGYHLTSVLLHGAAAIVFFFLARELLNLAIARDEKVESFWLGAAISALVFALHPLRVESVAWATERRDVLSGLFYVLTIWLYVKSCRAGELRWQRYCGILTLFICAVLSKSITVTLPAVLLILDVYPLKRLGGAVGWWNARARAIYLEKAPFFLISIAVSALGFFALNYVGNLSSLRTLGFVDRLTASAYSSWFYFWKTVAPFNLLPLYEMPTVKQLATLPFYLCYVFVAVVLALGIALRQRIPGVVAIAAVYAGTLLPVLGIFQNGPQIVADRYSYLACLGLALLVGAGGQYVWRLCARDYVRKPAAQFALCFVAAIIVGLGYLTWQQTQVWRDSETLWRFVVTGSAGTPFQAGFAHDSLGVLLANRGDISGASKLFERAVQLSPDSAKYHNQFGAALARQGRYSEAVRHYQEAIRLQPHPSFYNNLGAALAKLGQNDDAVQNFRKALSLRSDDSEAYFNLGNVAVHQGQLDQAIEYFAQATRIKPDFAEAHHNWGRVAAAQGRLDEAIEHFRKALEIRPGFAEARQSLTMALAERGR